ncbi:MAG: chain-length determining protein, partial [Prevotellaceae bacterium]|nr:chain-length determining protein [Prevotellaceae bacterium]
MDNTDNLHKDTDTSETEIDLVELISKFWRKRWFIAKVCGIGFVAGVIIALSIPKEYTTTVILAPDGSSSGSGGNLGALASMAGINLQQGASSSEISPELYPDIASSTPFLTGLFDVKVKDRKNDIDTLLYNYLYDYQKAAWWSYVFGLPWKILGLLSSAEEESEEVVQGSEGSKIITLSKEQTSILESLKSRITISVDKKTGVITLTVQMQSPEISATIADVVTSYLQEYVISYRTEKARQDLAFTKKLYEESKAAYDTAQQAYTTYIDKNQGIILASYRTTQEKLQNEMALTYSIYNQIAQQLQLAKVKVQDMTPVYTIIQPSVVPLNASSPRKILILV